MKSLITKGTAAFALSLLLASASLANQNETCVFAPQNTLKIPVSMQKAGSGLDEVTYNSAVDLVENYYKPIVAAKGASLTINRMWTDDTVNSTAHRKGKSWQVDAYGGLARYPLMTKDAEVAVLCHEMGHHLGGFPRGHGPFGIGTTWAANEGQADYFATMKCFRRVNANDNNVSMMASATIQKEVKQGCEANWHSAQEISLCERANAATTVLAQILWELGRQPDPTTGKIFEPTNSPLFSTTSTVAVSKTDDQHPLAQCRLDTYFNGSICPADAMEDFSQTEGKTGACAQEKGDTFGYRPTCWYKPGH